MRTSRITAAVTLLLSAEQCLIAADGFVNGSFENNGSIGDLRVKAPDAWDVNVPAGKFSGRVVSGWHTDGQYSLSLRANWFVTYAGGEMATVSQMLVLDDVGRIGFDLKLKTLNNSAWSPGVCTAMVLIDDDAVWQSNFAQADIQGEYPDQTCKVDGRFRDGQSHRVSLGLKMHVAGMQFETYECYWDGMELLAPAGDGEEPLAGDFNHDGYVDAGDLAMMAATWAAEVPPQSEYNLSAIDDGDLGGIVNFFDLAVLGGNWLSGSVQE